MNKPQELLYDHLSNDRMYRLTKDDAAIPETPRTQRRLRARIQSSAIYACDEIAKRVVKDLRPSVIDRGIIGGKLALKPINKHFFIEYTYAMQPGNPRTRVGVLFEALTLDEHFRFIATTRRTTIAKSLELAKERVDMSKAKVWMAEWQAKGQTLEEAIEAIEDDDLWHYVNAAKEAILLDDPDHLDKVIAHLEELGVTHTLSTTLFMFTNAGLLGPSASEMYYLNAEGKSCHRPEQRLLSPMGHMPPDDQVEALMHAMRPAYMALHLLSAGLATTEWATHKKVKPPLRYRLIVSNNKENLGWPTP